MPARVEINFLDGMKTRNGFNVTPARTRTEHSKTSYIVKQSFGYNWKISSTARTVFYYNLYVIFNTNNYQINNYKISVSGNYFNDGNFATTL